MIIIEYFIYTKINFHKIIYPIVYKDIDHNITNLEDFYDNVRFGRKVAQHSKIVVCCLCRNSELYIEKFFKRIRKTCDRFKEYKIVLFENDSTDNTRYIIKQEQQYDKNIILIKCCETDCDCKLNIKKMYDIGSFSPSRIEKMANFRNKYLEYVQTNLKDYNYMLVIDVDLVDDGEYSDYGLFHTLAFDFDAIAINGRVGIPGSFGTISAPYDALAFSYSEEDFSSRDFMKLYYSMNSRIKEHLENDELMKKTRLLKVQSAFNGLCLYNIKSIIGSKYDSKTPCEHRDLHKNMIMNGFDKIFINPYFMGYFKQQGPRDNIFSFFK